MIKRIIILLFLYVSALLLNAQNVKVDSAQLSQKEFVDTTMQEKMIEEDAILADTILTIHEISLPADSIKSWKSRKEFRYVRNLDSLLKVSQEEDAFNQNKAVSRPSILEWIFNSPILKWMLWIIAAIFLIAVLSQLIKNKGRFKRAFAKGIEMFEETSEAQTLDQDFDKQLQTAINNKDYRLAIRYQFLKTLKNLRDKELIDFAPDKTNSRYVHELPERFRNDFAGLILNYEYIWYGNFKPTADQYVQLNKKYSIFNNSI